MNRLNKKAVSAVVATVLIIMITVAAVGIIWAAIIPMVRDSLSKGTVCNDALSDISIGVAGYTCLASGKVCPSDSPYRVNATDCNAKADFSGTNKTLVDGKVISLQIKKGSNAKVQLVAVNALIFTGGDSESLRINGNNTGNIDGNLPTNNVEKVILLSGKDYTNATSVKIAPVVTVGKTEELCEATQEVILGPCA